MYTRILCGAALAASLLTAAPPQGSQSEVWAFDRLERIGGHPTTVVGQPRVVDTPFGKAVEFDGVGDALFIDVHPLAGAETFTLEVIFRPDPEGRPEQRFFHLQERGSDTRLLLETRLIGDKWALDGFAASSTGARALLDRTKLYPLGKWYNAAMTYDGKTFRIFINGELQGSSEVKLSPQAQGQTSVGVRINKIDWFKGVVREARMTRRALEPSEFLKPDAK